MEPTVAYTIQTFDSALQIAVFPIPGGSAYTKELIYFDELGVELDVDAPNMESPTKFKCRNPSQMTTFDIEWAIDQTRETISVCVKDHIGAVYRDSETTYKLSHLGLQPAQ